MRLISKKTIAQLNDWRSAFLQCDDYSDYKKIGITELTDDLSGIKVGAVKCYASFLFSSLNEQDKKDILNSIDFYVDFDNLSATYDI